MSPAVGTQNVSMPPRPSSSLSDGGGPPVRAGAPAAGPPPSGAPPPGAMLPQPYHYKPAPYPPQPYGYPPPRNHPYPYGGYRPTPPPHPSQHYPPLKGGVGRHMGPPGESMGPPNAPGEAHDNGPAPPATALVTTGPDGAPLDEGSQQSTLSNASAASGEEPCGTGKGSRKDYGSAAPSPSPGGGSHSSAHDDYETSPSPWPRPPSSPSDSLVKLYEMDDAPERRSWVERLLAFMEERRTPIPACPTISKQPLDLYRLYLLVRDRGGFVEVTKNKTWKDIAGLLGIGASSSAAYTLRKHYTKNLLAYECHFDRGGIDPQPIINQVEASTKKKSGKNNNAANAAGSSNNAEQFGGSGASGAPIDAYQPHYAPYPPQPAQQGYQQGYGYEYGSPYPGNRPVYPPYGPEGDRGYSPGEYGRYGGYGGPYRAGAPAPGPGAAPGAPAPPSPAGAPPAQPYPDYYRQPHPHQQHPPHPPHPPHSPQQQHEMSSCGGLMGSQLARQLVAPLPPASRPYQYGGKGAPPVPNAGPPGVAGAPRRHPDFAKEPYNSNAPPGAPPSPAGPRFGGGWGPGFQRAASPGWRPPHHAPLPHHQQPGWPPQPHQPHQPYHPPGATSGVGQIKRELTFPPECVEATVPAPEKRRRLTKGDVAPVDAWRIMMALKSGLLAETCWALDILNILLFDDTCIGFFGLHHLPGLLDLLLEHFQRSLADVFDAPAAAPDPWYAPPTVQESVVPPPRRIEPPDPADRVKVITGENYTLQSRRRVPVTFVSKQEDDALFAPEVPEINNDIENVIEPWQTDTVSNFDHVMPCFRAEFVHLPFARVLPGERAPSPPAPPASNHSDGPSETPAIPDSADPPPSEPPSTATDEGDNLEAEPMDIEPERKPTLHIRDLAGVLKRRRLEDYEDECYTRDEPSLNLINETRDGLAKRCIALSNILRGLTFVPGNEAEFSRSSAFLALSGKLLLLNHEHAPRAARAKAYERAARDEVDADACCSSLKGESEWWWDTLAQLREDALVCCANIAGSVELSGQPEAVARPLLDGLLHWSVCPAAVAGDAPPTASPASPLSPRRLALEALCKLCVTDANVDLVLATPPRGRIAALCAGLARDLCRPERPVVREFAVNLLHYLAGAGGAAAREVATHAPAVAQLVAFIERAEQTALGVANQHGVAALRDNPDAMGTSLDMLRRAAATLLRLAEHPENRPLIRRHERRLLSLVMSQILDQKVAHELAGVLYHCSQQKCDEPLEE